MSKTLSEHAAYELTRAGLTDHEDHEARQTSINIMALVRRFEKQKNNERQRDFILEALGRLLNGLPLTPLTDDPEEWEKFEVERKNVETGAVEKQDAWQSRRATSIFSYDKGKTWVDQATGKTGECADYVKEAERRKQEKEARLAAKESRGKIEPVASPVNTEAPADEVPLEASAATEDK